MDHSETYVRMTIKQIAGDPNLYDSEEEEERQLNTLNEEEKQRYKKYKEIHC